MSSSLNNPLSEVVLRDKAPASLEACMADGQKAAKTIILTPLLIYFFFEVLFG